ncbi:zinc finger protein 14-like [Uranotaenia lowii]|uniref:zinc finger protein 14-like n=1 Tax=Uranotaenia lowii TaxID=190385 RepID=UPI00247B27E4|nr:zinc finger protein 14-like [Uranotaenia lowii]
MEKLESLFSSDSNLSIYMCLQCSARIEILKSILSSIQQFTESGRLLEGLINKAMEIGNDEDTANAEQFGTSKPEGTNYELIGENYYQCHSPDQRGPETIYGLQSMNEINSEMFDSTDEAQSDYCVCRLCGEYFSSQQFLEDHIGSWHSKNLNSFECSICRQTFKNAEDFAAHYHEQDKTGFRCDVCEKTYKNVRTYRMHRKLHIDRVFYPCEFCNKTFKVKYYLQQHIKIHKEEVKFECDICGRTLSSGWYLEIHRKKHLDD